MTVSFVGAQGNAGTTVTIPTHQIGDLILIFAYRDGNNAAPTTPSAGGTVPTWDLIGSSGGNTNSSNFRFAVATATNTTSGTWTNATELICLVYRGAGIGISAGGGAQSVTIAYPALSLQRTDGSSWVVGVAGHRSATNVEVAPPSMTNRAFAGTEAAGHDTNGGVSSWSQETVTASANSGWRSWTVELRDKALDLPVDTGTYTLTGNTVTLTVGSAPNNYVLDVDAGTFTLTGNPAGLQQTHRTIVDAGSYVVTGNNANLLRAYRVIADDGTYTVTGNDAALRRGYRTPVDAGSYVVTGNAATLQQTHRTIVDAGSYVFTGNPATLSVSGGLNNYTLSVDKGTFILTGNDAALLRGHRVIADLGKFFLPERNLRLWSESFDNGAWTKTNASITANATIAPDGTLTADALIENTANSTHVVNRNTLFTAGVKYTASLYVKTYLGRDVGLLLGTTAAFGGASNTVVVFLPSTNTFLSVQNSPEAYGSEDVGNGWYRIYITKTAVSTATVISQVQLRIGVTNTYTGDGTSGLYVWGAQLEEGDLTDYDPTGPSAATRVDGLYSRVLPVDRGLYTLTGRPANLGTPVTTVTRYILIT